MRLLFWLLFFSLSAFAYLLFWLNIAIITFFVVFFFFLISFRIVRPNTVRTVEFLGKYSRVLRQWFHIIIPILEQTKIQYLYKKNFAVEVQGVTSDNVTCFVGLNVISYVNDDKDDSLEWNIFKSIYSINDPVTMIKATIDEQLRAMMIQFTHKEIFGKREEIGQEIEEKLREKLKSFWFTLDSIQVRDVTLDKSVMDAMNKIVESLKLKEAAFNEADATKIKIVKSAEADKESKLLIGQGMAAQREAISEWFKESIEKIKSCDKSLDAKDVLAFLLNSSRIEALEKIWANNAKVIYVNENLEGKTTSLIQNEK